MSQTLVTATGSTRTHTNAHMNPHWQPNHSRPPSADFLWLCRATLCSISCVFDSQAYISACLLFYFYRCLTYNILSNVAFLAVGLLLHVSQHTWFIVTDTKCNRCRCTNTSTHLCMWKDFDYVETCSNIYVWKRGLSCHSWHYTSQVWLASFVCDCRWQPVPVVSPTYRHFRASNVLLEMPFKRCLKLSRRN